ncbi:MAG: Gfo/Idh/MocA family oxidoreductase [Fimbriimonadaceae bacterium]|nr:Gfo/Idh/MocA family oxidoreductase [Fimbriimonadaceae bacterium]
MDRRHFLRSSGAAAAGLGVCSIVPAFGQGAGRRLAPSERIAVGCIGMGGMGSGNLSNFLGQPDVQVLAVCDVDRQRLASAKATVDKRYGQATCAATTDFRELLARGDLDAVVISTPDHWHAIPAIWAMRAGLDVYGEKPMSHSLLEGRAIVQAQQQYGRIWQTGSWQRSTGSFKVACELVRNGRIGKISRIEIGLPSGKACGPVTFGEPPPELDYEMWLGPGEWAPYCAERVHYNFRFQYAYGGGKIMDWVPHHGDIALWGIDYDHSGPVAISGVGDFPTAGIYDSAVNFAVVCEFANGCEMHISNKLRGGCKWFGENGQWVWVDRGGFDANPKILLRERIGPDERQLYHSTNHVRNFLDCIRSRREAITPAEVAHRAASLGHLGNIAMRLGRKIRFDPAQELVLGDPSGQQMLTNSQRAPWHL